MECDCCSKNAVLFKLSLIGFMASLALMVAGIIPPISSIAVRFPIAWVMALLILIPSITVYYDVKEAFWAEVAAWKKKKSK